MRIERIRIQNYANLREIDWIFPIGPVLISFEDICHQKLFHDLLLTIFYDQQEPQLLSGLSTNTLVEVWMSGEGFHNLIRHEFLQKENELKRHTTLFDETGRTVCLPEKKALGEYLFNAQFQAFLQGGTVEWPERDNQDDLIMRIGNLSQGGDEELSLRKMRATLAGAQKRVKEQSESMELIKADYDALRLEWETAHRQQEDERLLQIEMKNLQEKEAILTESIAVTTNIQLRLELLSQNPDYRELRQLQDEINRLEERWQCIEANLKAISCESSADWIIESFREECMEWACLQKDVERLAVEAQVRSKRVGETQYFLLTSGYHEFVEDEDLKLNRIIEERDAAQDKLNKLIRTKQRLDKLKLIYSQEYALFSDLANMSDVTEDNNNWIAKKEKNIELWRSSKVCSILDRILRKLIGVKSIDEILSSRLLHYYRRYHVSDYQEFTSQLKEFRNQRKRIQKVQRQIGELQEKVNQETKLRRIVNFRDEILKQAFTAVNVADFTEWLNGWVDYQRKKNQLSLELNQLNLDLEQKLVQEKKLAEYVERMSENLKNWGIPTTDREEVLAAVLKVASQLHERDEVKRELAAFSESFDRMLGDRDMQQLSKILEPLAELERENRLSNEKRQEEMSSWDKRRLEIRRQIEDLNQRLRSKRKIPSLSVLEKKIEQKKRQWTGYEDLRHALDDAQTLLELSWQEWQMKYEKTLSEEKQWIYDQCFSSATFKFMEGETIAKRNYFSYRMAVAQLALRVNTEAPLFFSARKISNEDKYFWEDVVQYLHKLSFSRQVIFSTTDYKQFEKLSGKGWPSLYFRS